MWRAWMLVLVTACGAPPAVPPRDAEPPARAPVAPAVDAGPPSPAASGTSLRDDEAVPLDPRLARCNADVDCTYISLGCCHVTPVARAEVVAGRAALDASGARYCPVKAACGPTPNGTYDGAPGSCRAHVCR